MLDCTELVCCAVEAPDTLEVPAVGLLVMLTPEELPPQAARTRLTLVASPREIFGWIGIDNLLMRASLVAGSSEQLRGCIVPTLPSLTKDSVDKFSLQSLTITG